MNMQSQKSMRAPLLIAGIAALLFSGVAMTTVPVTGWFRSSFEDSAGISAREPLTETPAAPPSVAPAGAGKARAKVRCEECGVIESMRRVSAVGNSPAINEITVRLGDGSTHVLSDARPANWRTGERINFIRGGNRSGS